MALYTYSFVQPSERALILPMGIQQPTQLLGVEHLAAIVEPDLEIERLQTNDDQLMQAVLAHDRVIQSVFEQTVVLPLRFATCFTSADRLLEHLKQRSPAYQKFLSDYAGKAEYTLKAQPLDPPPEPSAASAKGKDYLLQKKKKYLAQSSYQQRQNEELETLLQEIGALYPYESGNSLDADVQRINILCDRHEEDALRERCQTWDASFACWSLMLSDALPPYHFVSLND